MEAETRRTNYTSKL